MPVTDSFLQFVLEQLEPVAEITSRQMFGGVGVYSRDLFFALLDNDVLYLKVNDTNRADFEAAGSRPFQPYGPGTGSMQYYEVPVSVLEDADELARWSAKAIAVAQRKKTGNAKAAKPAKKNNTTKSAKKPKRTPTKKNTKTR